MHETKFRSNESILMNTDKLRELTGLGRDAAIRLGTEAGAKVVVGRLIYWHRKKVIAYIEGLAGKDD